MLLFIIYLILSLVISFIMVCEDFYSIRRIKKYTKFEFIKDVVIMALILPIVLFALFIINLSFLDAVVNFKKEKSK